MRADYSRNDQVELTLLPPFDRLLRARDVEVRIDRYYFDSPLFDAYERDFEARSGETEWDLPALRSTVPDDGSVLEIGCGMGRVLADLAANTAGARLVGIDTSRPALDRAAARISPADRAAGRVTLIRGDAVEHRFDETFDAVLVADCSLNGFTELSDVEALLARARDLLNPGGRIGLSIFADGAREELAHLDGHYTLDTFRDTAGAARLIHWSMRFDGATGLLHRTAMVPVERPDGRIRCVVSDVFDTIWTPAVLVPSFDRLGLVLDRVEPAAVDGGAAGGTATVTVVLARA
ncbi:class I SAM-dependent methyltransferase [Kitasatospora sp. NPDC094028]